MWILSLAGKVQIVVVVSNYITGNCIGDLSWKSVSEKNKDHKVLITLL